MTSDDRGTTIAVAPHGDTFQHVAHRRRDGRRRRLVRHARHRSAAARVALLDHPAERRGADRERVRFATWPSRLMARASSTSAPTARRSSCERSISSTPRRSPGSTRRLDRSSRQTASGSAFFDGASAPALKKVAITGGPAVTLGRPDGPTRGASWGADGTIIFATTQCGDWPAADRGRGRRADRADATEPGARRSRPCLAGDSAGRPGGAVHDHRHDWRTRPGAGRRPRSPDRHADRADSGRQRRALRVERPSRLRRGGDAAGRRLRPRPARRRRHVRGGSAPGA